MGAGEDGASLVDRTLDRAASFGEWPHGVVQLGVIFLVVVTGVAVGARYLDVVGDLGATASRNSALSYADREIAGGNDVVEEQLAVYEARARIPRDAMYHVAVGGGFEPESDLTVPYVASYYRYFLMPRRQTESAPWVVCYGCDLAPYGDRAKVVWSNGQGISIVWRPQ